MAKDLSGAQTGVVQRASVNDPRPGAVGGRNEFPQTYKHLTTDRYGEFSPFFWTKAERGDVQNLHAVHDLHTYTLTSPMVSDVKMTKSFFKVPMQAIYPRNWEKMMTIPTQGDDVPSDTRALLDFTGLFTACYDTAKTQFRNVTNPEFLRRNIILLELLGSNGSLFYRFNQHVNVSLGFGPDPSIDVDTFIDEFYTSLISYIVDTNADVSLVNDFGQIFKLSPNNKSSFVSNNFSYVTYRRFVELFRDNGVSLRGESWSDVLANANTNMDHPLTDSSAFNSYVSSSFAGQPTNSRFINIEPIISYQLSCAQFGTNDFVDFIYSAQLFRDNQQSIISGIIPEFPTFSYNGVKYLYDIFSEHLFTKLIYAVSTSSISALNYFINLFSYNKSLRFGDYFTGAKPRPLAVGEYSAQVNNNEVSAIDVTRSIQMQRLLNRVNMVGRKLGDYLSGIFGGPIPQAPKDVPIFLAHQKYDIKGFEVNNTGDMQFNVNEPNTITSQLRSADNRHIFEIEIDEPCYIIGINSYETPRIYSMTMDRFSFHHDRYDDFIPQMQYIGDQSILPSELSSTNNSMVPFAYTLRFMEYKQRYSYASGGFISNLPSWAFITDNSDGTPPDDVITPDYIRSSPSEFDRFYKSLSGYSLGSYFHFIVAHTNVTSPSRMMDYTPEILK